jgi:hypothetical protein
VAIVLAAFAVFAPSASAGLLFTGKASTCDPEVTRPFLPWMDTAGYALAGGGSFEAGTPDWTLRGGAAEVHGNEPFYAEDDGGVRSLSLPAGSSAVSPTTCFGFGHWHLRFFVRNPGKKGSLDIDVVVPTALGLVSILDGGSVKADGTWDPSPRVSLLLSNLGGLLATQAVAFRFRAVGAGAAFQVDDVYVDPFKSS